MAEGKLQPDREHQKDDAELRDMVQLLGEITMQPEKSRDDDSRGDVSDHRRNVEALQNEVERHRKKSRQQNNR